METKITKKRPSLAEVLSYQNANVISGFIKAFGVSVEEATDIFEQVKRMLWLINEMEFDGHREEHKMFSIDASLLVIDEMWHIFILFTKDYREFCFKNFGHFIDHKPTVKDDSDAEQVRRNSEFAALDYNAKVAKVMDEKRWQYRYVFEKLGREHFYKWYTEFHKKYTPKKLAELRLQAI